MKICPVDLGVCGRPECGGRHCAMAETPHMTICWECGDVVDRHGMAAGFCVACVTVHAKTTREEA